jgi:hypothetical protein
LSCGNLPHFWQGNADRIEGTVRSISSAAQGKKPTEATQLGSILRAMIQKRDMLVNLASNRCQERAVPYTVGQ